MVGMGYFRVELNAEEVKGWVGDGRDRAIVGRGKDREARRGMGDKVSMAHPARSSSRNGFSKRA
jgi:hypothetical protein